MRGWWGNPWGFESPLRHHDETRRSLGEILGSFFVSSQAEGGTRTGEGRRANSEEERDFRSAEVPSPAAMADRVIAEAQAVESPLMAPFASSILHSNLLRAPTWAGTLLSRIPKLNQECPRWRPAARFPFFVLMARVADLWLSAWTALDVGMAGNRRLLPQSGK